MMAKIQIQKLDLDLKFNEAISYDDNDSDLGFDGDFETKDKLVIPKKAF